MSNEKNLKKLNKTDVSNVSGGWYVKYEAVDLEGENGPTGTQMERLRVFDNNGSPLGTAASFDEAKNLAQKHNCTNFDPNRSNRGPF